MFLFSAHGLAATANDYVLVDLNLPGAGSFPVTDINERGQILGTTIDTDFVQEVARTFIWERSARTEIKPRNDKVSFGIAINNHGGVVLEMPNPRDCCWISSSPFVWTQDESFRLLDDLSYVWDINDRGLIVGELWLRSDVFKYQATLLDAGGEPVVLEGLGGNYSFPTAINDSSASSIVGGSTDNEGLFHAVRWSESGIVEDLGLWQGEQTFATDVNDNDQIVGWIGKLSDIGTEERESRLQYLSNVNIAQAFVSDQDRGYTPLGTFADDNSGRSIAYKINNVGQVVGLADDNEGQQRAFLYDSVAGLVDLNSLIPPDSGWVLEVASAINDKGQIVGWGSFEGERRAFLLTAPEHFAVTDIFADQRIGSRSLRMGETVSLHTTVANRSSEPADINLEFNLPPALVAEPMPGSCIKEEKVQTVRCALGSFSAEEQQFFDLTLKAVGWGHSKIESVAKVTTSDGVFDQEEFVSYIQISRADPDAGPVYFVESIGTKTIIDDISKGPRINNWGQVSFHNGDLNDRGWRAVTVSGHARLTQGELYADINPFSSTVSSAYGINAAGEVVGSYVDSSDFRRAFLRELDGVTIDLGTLGGDVGEAFDINDACGIVGESSTSGGARLAFSFTIDQGMRNLGTLGGDESYAYAINNANQIVGAAKTTEGELHAALWENDQVKDLGVLPGGVESRALDINTHGTAVGDAVSAVGGELRPVIFGHDGPIDLSVVTNLRFQSATGINDYGDIVGTRYNNAGRNTSVFLLTSLSWQPPVYAEEIAIPELDAPPSSSYGSVVATNGDWIAIGAPEDDTDMGENAGAVYLYRRINDIWSYFGWLIAADGVEKGGFGRALAMDDGVLVIGAIGAAYLYRWNGEGWLQDSPTLGRKRLANPTLQLTL